MSTQGNRMFRLDLGETALSFLARTSVEDIKHAKSLKKTYSSKFGGQWLKYTDNEQMSLVWNDVYDNSKVLKREVKNG